MIELCTYRLGGHSTSDDPKVYRSDDELEAYKKQDPILRLRRHLEQLSAWSERDEKALVERVDNELKTQIAVSEQKAPPSLETLVDDVYAERPWHLTEQLKTLQSGPRPKKGH
jgi:pyruvate dehydrogenase E1 component alpha subunit